MTSYTTCHTYSYKWQSCCWASWCSCGRLPSRQQCTPPHSAGCPKSRRWCWCGMRECGHQAQLLQQYKYQRRRLGPSWQSRHWAHTAHRWWHHWGCTALRREWNIRADYTHGVKRNKANVDNSVRYVAVPVLKKAGLLGMLSQSLPRPCTVTL